MTRLQVEIEDFVRAARTVHGDVGEPVRMAVDGLASALAECGAMAGDDEGGRSWAASYDPAADSVLEATNQIVAAAYYTASLFGVSACNYAAAEDASTPGGSSRQAQRTLQGLPETGRVPCAAAPPTAAGGSGGDEPTGWSFVKSLVGYVWPNGHQDKLRRAAEAYRHCASAINKVASVPLGIVADFVAAGLPEAEAIADVCRTFTDRMGEVAHAHRSLANVCDQLAAHLDECHREVESELTDLLVESAGLQVAGAVASVFSAGLAEGPTQAAQAARIAAAATRVAALIRKFFTAARTLLESIPTLTELARAVTRSLEAFTNGRLAYAGITAVPSIERASSLAKSAAQARRAIATSRLGNKTRAALRMLSKTDGGIPGGTTRLGVLMRRFKCTRTQMNDAIHEAKRAARLPDNPDVVIDEAGEIYPLGRDGVAGDSIGNIFDFLGD